MRIRSMIAFVVIGLGTSSAATPQPQLEAVMTIPGIPGQIRFLADRTDWAQIEGMPDPRDSRGAGVDSLVGSRAGSLLTSRGAPSGADAGHAGIQDVSITKHIDPATPKIGDLCASGNHIRDVVLEIQPAGGAHGECLVITMHDVVISRVSQQPVVGRETPTEVVSFRCQSLEWESRPAAASPRASPAYPITPRPR